MPRTKEIRIFFITLFFFLCCSLLFLLGTALLQEKSSENLLHVPKTATTVCIVATDKIIEKTLFDLLIRSKDEDLLVMLQKSIRSNRKKEGSPLNGVDLFSAVVYFEDEIDKKRIAGIILNLTDEELFLSNLQKNKKIGAAKNGVGVVLSDYPSNTILRAKLISYCRNLVTLKGRNLAFKQEKNENQLLHFYLFDEQNELLNLSISANSETIVLEGHTTTPPKKKKHTQLRLSSRVLHLSSSYIPESLNDSIQRLIQRFNLDIPSIESFSINYRGCRIEQSENGMAILPLFDAIIQFTEPIEVKELISNRWIQKIPGATLENNGFVIGQEKYFFKQLNEKSLYVGKHAAPILANQSSDEILLLKGNLTALTNIQAGGFVGAFIEMIPLYKSSKLFTEHIHSAEIKVSEKGKMIFIHSELQFKEGYFPLTELMRFALVGQLLN